MNSEYQEHGVRVARVVRELLGVERTVVEDVGFETDDHGRRVLVVQVRSTKRASGRCQVCRRSCRGYDRGAGPRRWRGLDLGTLVVQVQAAVPRVRCRVHGVVSAWVPWARAGSRFTSAFEDQAAWLIARTAKATVAELMRISWRSCTRIVQRVTDQARAGTDRLGGLRRIGIDDKSYRKGHAYLMVVVDHDTGRVVWARQGRDQDTVRAFFDDLGPARAAALTHVSCDGAGWIHQVITERAPAAAICMDPFHVVQWAGEKVDEVRRRVTREATTAGLPLAPGRMRWALLKDPMKLSGTQRTTLAQVKRLNAPIYRAYLIKEQVREAFKVKGERGKALLTGVIAWARRSRLPEMTALAATLTTYQTTINNALDADLGNARVEATNTHIQALIARARGYDTAEALIAMIDLTRGGLCPPLPGR